MSTLSSVAELIMGQSPPSDTYNDKGDGLPFYQGKSDFGFKYPTPRLYCSSPKKVAEAGDILISVRAPVGPTNIASEKSCIGRGLGAIRAQTIDSDYLYFNLRYIEPYIASLGTGSTFRAINKHQLANLEVNPIGFDIPEQRCIADVLITVQTVIEQQSRLIALTRELKSALMNKLFTEGLRDEKQKVTEIGLVPASWKTIKLGDVCSITTGTTPATGNAEYYDGDVPFIKTSEIANNRINAAAVYITQKAVEDYNLKIYPKDTVFMAMYGQGKTRGQVAILDIPATTSQNTAAIKCGKSVEPEFLWQWLMSRYDNLRNTGALGHLSHLNLGYVKRYEIALPYAEEQKEIAQILNVLGNKIDCIERKRIILTDLFRNLLHQLMTGQTRLNDVNILDLS